MYIVNQNYDELWITFYYLCNLIVDYVKTFIIFIVCNEIYFILSYFGILDLVRSVELCISTACPQDPLLGGNLPLSYEAGYPRTLLIRIPRPG